MKRTGRQQFKKATKKPRKVSPTTRHNRRFQCPLCDTCWPSNATRLIHMSTNHFSEASELADDFLDGFHAGVKEYAVVVKARAKAIRDVVELERMYRLPSGPTVGRRRKGKKR